MADGFLPLDASKITTPEGVNEINRMLRQLFMLVGGDGETRRVYNGIGSPEGVVSAGIGSIYMRSDGTTDTSVYVKESGTGATGWVAMGSWDNIIENRTSDPSTPATGQIWYRTDL
jgi:hypothetical protein